MKKNGPPWFSNLIYPLMKLHQLLRIFFCIVLMATVGSKHAFAQSPLEKTITINLNNVPLKQALDQLTAASGVRFTYNEAVAASNVKITINAKGQSLRQVLDVALAAYPYSFTELDQDVLIRYDATKPKKLGADPAAKPATGKFTISGTITSKQSGETMIGATVRVANGAQGTSSNGYGFYSLTLPAGDHQLIVSAIGQKTVMIPISLTADKKLNIALEDNAQELQTVTITATPQGGRDLKSPQMGVEKLSIKEINDIPVLLGEHDVIKTIQLLPGIKSAGEGSGGFYVRGGATDQNLLLLDEATVYNASHLLGFFSTFNSDAIKNVSIYKGDMPAQYGGRLSSVIDIKMNDGNNQQFGVSGGIGLIAARLNVEGPIQKGKSSFLISARRTYADVFLKFAKDTTINRSQLYFYDINAKANYILGDKDRLYVSGYFGKDVLSADNVNGINWGNTTATLRWNHIFNNRFFSNTSFIYSNYDYEIKLKQDVNNYNITSRIHDWNFKEDMQYDIGGDHTLSFGLNSVYHTIKPGEISATGNSGIVSQKLETRYALDNAAYVSDTWKATDRFSLTYGLRLSAFSVLGAGTFYNVNSDGDITDFKHYNSGQVVKTYLNPEPRVAAAFQLNDISSVKASYARNAQNLHLISNSTPGSPTDKWVASTNLIKPELADQFSIGYYRDLAEHKYEFTVETYYKLLQNQVDYRNGANIFTNQPIETQLLYGKGRAYGAEFLIKKKTGRLTGWVSYTLSKSERLIDGINDNQWYNARQDRTHDLAVVGIYKLNEKWTLSANFVFYTGDAVTYPSGKYQIDGTNYYLYTSRNGSRLPAYNRLDLGATKQLKKTKKYSSELTFSLYNAFGNRNAYRIFFRDNKDDPNRTEAVKTTLFTYVPSITYNFKF
ncbi:TonB-dependent receptor [Mucilaginibacter aquaedulcis]|uniref:TonB-dependent receptor n=1 Tax=Mucilaginibacter aquaedulcis TaxID=1187081 RepID=UPI0025B56FBE|nr:TonB-dependent receptor [Mucilaginibacter aquaedulcis]MDN3547263.1 TonB-dependent receptor [Mucilaginibacter aquaedulcis]